MKRNELKKLTRRELYGMARAYDITGRSKMAKEDLVDALARVSAKKVMPKPTPKKRRIHKARKSRTVEVRKRAARSKKPSSTSVAKRPAAREPRREQAPAVYVDRGPELPNDYGDDKLAAMVRDPNWIYIYWDLSGGKVESLGAGVTGGAWVLRVHNLTDSNHEDVPVIVDSRNWYLPVESDTAYRIEIGLVDMAGTFHAAASSRQVKTPRMGISESVDEEWLIMEDEFRRLMDVSGRLKARFAGSHFMSEIISRRRGGMTQSAGVSSFSSSRRR